MELEIAFSKRAARWIRKSADEKTRDALIEKIEQVAKDQTLSRKWFEKLSNRPEWKVRQGDFRAIIEFDETTLTVLDIDHRRNVYR